jgi:hypothetical protein
MTTTNARPAVAAIAMTALLMACSSSRSEWRESGRAQDDAVQIEVTNNNWSDMTVYVWHGSTRRRLGMVTTGNTGRFGLPAHLALANRLRLEAHPIGGGRSYRSDPIQVHGGERVILSIENHVAVSSLWIRN